MKLLAISILMSGFALANPDRQAAPLDQSDPVKVLEAVFSAAATGDTSQLPTLCHDRVESDGDVRSVCAMTREDKDFGEFAAVFAGAKVKGPARIEGDKAAVDFDFGPNGPQRSEEMNLRKHMGKWYLSSF